MEQGEIASWSDTDKIELDVLMPRDIPLAINFLLYFKKARNFKVNLKLRSLKVCPVCITMTGPAHIKNIMRPEVYYKRIYSTCFAHEGKSSTHIAVECIQKNSKKRISLDMAFADKGPTQGKEEFSTVSGSHAYSSRIVNHGGYWKSRENQYIQFVRVLYCKLPTNGKQLPAFPIEAVLDTEPRPQRWEARVLQLCHCGPTDISRVFRQLKVDPRDIDLLGLKMGDYYFDQSVPFGFRHGSSFLEKVTDSIRFIMNKNGFPDLYKYVDDLLYCGLTSNIYNHLHSYLIY